MLIVEDEEIVRILLQELLRRQGVGRMTLAFNGAEGLAALAVADYDLVLSDIRMPVMNGTELYLRARAFATGFGAPVCLCHWLSRGHLVGEGDRGLGGAVVVQAIYS